MARVALPLALICILLGLMGKMFLALPAVVFERVPPKYYTSVGAPVYLLDFGEDTILDFVVEIGGVKAQVFTVNKGRCKARINYTTQPQISGGEFVWQDAVTGQPAAVELTKLSDEFNQAQNIYCNKFMIEGTVDQYGAPNQVFFKRVIQ